MSNAARITNAAAALLLAVSTFTATTPVKAQDAGIDVCVLNPQACQDYVDAYPEPPAERPHDDHPAPEPQPEPEPEPEAYPHTD